MDPNFVRLAGGQVERDDADMVEATFGFRPPGSPSMSRADHLAWAKERALEYVDDDPSMAFTSLVSDLGKHPNLREHPGLHLGTMLLVNLSQQRRTKEEFASEMRNHIEGYN